MPPSSDRFSRQKTFRSIAGTVNFLRICGYLSTLRKQGLSHLPLFLIPGYNGAGVGFVGVSTALLVFTLMTSLLSTMFAWVYNNTRGSLLLVMLLHTSINVAGSFFPAQQSLPLGQIIIEASVAVVALIIIIATRGRLSYDRYGKTEPSKTDQVSSDIVA